MTLAKCHHLVGHFKHSALATNGLNRKQKTLGFKKSLCVVQKVPTRWNSTFYMMQRLVQLKQPICLYLEDTMSEDEVKSYDLSDHQWSVVKSILRESIRLLKYYLVNVTLHCHGAYLCCLDYERRQSPIGVTIMFCLPSRKR